jgi:Tol biopolymer transport system component
LGDKIARVTGNEGHEIWVSGLDGQNDHKLVEDKNVSVSSLAWSPSGRRLAYVAETKGSPLLGTVDVSNASFAPALSSQRIVTFQGGISDLAWLPDGRLLFPFDEPDDFAINIYALSVDPDRGTTDGQPVKVTSFMNEYPLWINATLDGRKLLVSRSRNWQDVGFLSIDKSSHSLSSNFEPLTLTRSDNSIGGWTLDGGSILFHTNQPRRYQIFSRKLGDETAAPIVQSGEDDRNPVVSPDGKWILYWSSAHASDAPDKNKHLMRYPAGGGSSEKVLDAPPDDAIAFKCPRLASAGCLLTRPDKDGKNLLVYSLDTQKGQGRVLTTVPTADSQHLSWSLSPDGSRLLLTSGVELHSKARLLSLRDGSSRIITISPETEIRVGEWAADGNSFYVITLLSAYGLAIQRIDLSGKIIQTVNLGKNHSFNNLIPSPDGTHLAFDRKSWESNNWLFENF